MLVNLSGRGDKDVDTAAKWFGVVSDEEMVRVGDGRGRAGPAGRVRGGLVTTPVSRLDEMLAAARAEGRAALVGYLPPATPRCRAASTRWSRWSSGGVDIVEVGLPYPTR